MDQYHGTTAAYSYVNDAVGLMLSEKTEAPKT